MTRFQITTKGVQLQVQTQGSGAPLVFSNSLGTDLSIWDGVVAALPPGLQIIRYDMRGHGASSRGAPPYAMGQLVADAEAVCDAVGTQDAVFVGLSVGGMVGQGLAIKRLDLVRALVLSNTAAKIGTPKLWQERIKTVQAKGMAPMADAIMDRWFGKDFRQTDRVTPWRRMVADCDPDGYCGVCAAIAGTDFYTPTSGLRLPTLGIAGSEDRATPPDLVRETVDLIPGSDFRLMRRLGHLPCVEDPAGYAAVLTDFLRRIGHLP